MIYVDSFTDKAVEILNNPIFSGLTTNPTILKNDRNSCGFEKAIIELDSLETLNFIQGSLSNQDWIGILKNLVKTKQINPAKIVIKLPWVSTDAPFLVSQLQRYGFMVCATAVYSLRQCYTAVLTGVDYVAVYYNRMKACGIDSDKIIGQMVTLTKREESKTRLLAASIKDVSTANKLLLSGVDDLTLPLDVAEAYLESNFPMNDYEVFESDFHI